MEVFATVEDLMADPTAPEIDDDAAEDMLKRASAYLWALLTRNKVEVNPDDEVQMTNLRAVCCNMVSRRIHTSRMDGVASIAQSVGSTNVSLSVREPDGSFFLSKADKELLGITGNRGFRSVRAAIHKSDGSLVEGW